MKIKLHHSCHMFWLTKENLIKRIICFEYQAGLLDTSFKYYYLNFSSFLLRSWGGSSIGGNEWHYGGALCEPKRDHQLFRSPNRGCELWDSLCYCRLNHRHTLHSNPAAIIIIIFITEDPPKPKERSLHGSRPGWSYETHNVG